MISKDSQQFIDSVMDDVSSVMRIADHSVGYMQIKDKLESRICAFESECIDQVCREITSAVKMAAQGMKP